VIVINRKKQSERENKRERENRGERELKKERKWYTLKSREDKNRQKH
jgi:hypothetical protein